MNKVSTFPVGLFLGLLLALGGQSMAGSDAPYPQSKTITKLSWSPEVLKIKGYANGDNWPIACSTNSGVNWAWADWHFSDTYGCPAFVQFGKDYEGARDEYVYIASQANDSAYGYSPDIVMARVRKDSVMKRSSYTFFGDRTEDGQPIWVKDVAKQRPIFTDPKGTQRIAITYNAGLSRYILTSSHLTGQKPTHTAALGVFEAPEPWGPWSTMHYDDHWSVHDGKDCRMYHHRFPPKWMSADGKTMWLLYSGLDCDLYSFCLKKATLEDDTKEANLQTRNIEKMKSSRLRILVPAYFAPRGEGLACWDKLLEASDRVPIVAILAPAVGPGTKPDPDYVNLLKRAEKTKPSARSHCRTGQLRIRR